MNYSEAIVYLKENDIRKDDGSFYEFGEVRVAVETSFLCASPHTPSSSPPGHP